MKQKLQHLRPFQKNKRASLLFLTCSVLLSTKLHAGSITIEYAGILHSLDAPVSPYFASGETFNGTVTYSTTEYNGILEDFPSADLWRSGGSHDVVTEFSLDIGDFHFAVSNVGMVDIIDDVNSSFSPHPYDRMTFSIGNVASTAQYDISPSLYNFIDESAGPLSDWLHMDDVYLDFYDYTRSVFTDTSLPSTFPGFEAFTDRSLVASFYENGGGVGLGAYVGTLYGTMTSIDVVPQVPIPPAAWLFGSGVIFFLGFFRTKNSDVTIERN